LTNDQLTVSESAYEAGLSAATNVAADFRKHFEISSIENILKHSDKKNMTF
jgi:hypothetical protein